MKCSLAVFFIILPLLIAPSCNSVPKRSAIDFGSPIHTQIISRDDSVMGDLKLMAFAVELWAKHHASLPTTAEELHDALNHGDVREHSYQDFCTRRPDTGVIRLGALTMRATSPSDFILWQETRWGRRYEVEGHCDFNASSRPPWD